MAAPAYVAGAAQLAITLNTIDADGAIRPCVNLLTFAQTVDSVTPPNLVQLNLATNALLSAKYGAIFATDVSCVSAIWRDLVHPTLPNYVSATPNNWSGAGTPPSQSTQESAYLKLTTANKTKSFRGALHLSPMPQLTVVDNHLTAGQITLIGTFLTALVDASGFSDGVNVYFPFVWSRKFSVMSTVYDCQIAGTRIIDGKIRKSTGRMIRRTPKGVY